MNIENIKSFLTVEQHLIFELLLCLVIAFLLFKPSPSIRMNTDGFSKETAMIFTLEFDGKVNVTAKNGKTTTIIPEKDLLDQETSMILNSIGIVIIADNKNTTNKQVGIMDRIISPAMATMHNLPGHNYYNYQWTLGGVQNCVRYDITGYPAVPPKNVGACF